MKFTTILSLSLLILLAAGCQPDQQGQQEEDTTVEHRRSPIVISSVTHQGSYIKVVYGQPYKHRREIFGGLEPLGEVWRTGANEATEITFTEDVLFGGEPVEAGTYSLFTIPNPNEWTVILNRELGQWGAFTYDPEQDYLRIQVPLQRPDSIVEALMIDFSDVENNQTHLTIAWDDAKIEIPIALGTHSENQN